MSEDAVINWDSIIHKNVRSKDGQDAGNVVSSYCICCMTRFYFSFFEIACIIIKHCLLNQEDEPSGTILYTFPLRVRIYKYPSLGPTWISVITPNPFPSTAPPSWSSCMLFAILSASGPSSTNPVLSSFNLKLYKLPKSTSPINIVFSYCLPNLSEFRNLRAVGAIVRSVASSGALYTPFPSKVTKSLGGILLSAPMAGPGLDPASHIPATCDQPLLNPGLTRLISSPKVLPFSVSHKSPVEGSKSIPKVLRIPYA